MSSDELAQFKAALEANTAELREIKDILVGCIDKQSRKWVPGIAQNQLENMITLHGDSETGRVGLLKRMGDAEDTLNEYREERRRARDHKAITWRWIMLWGSVAGAVVELAGMVLKWLFHK